MSHKFDISVIIVNYNVKYFLVQCLHSVVKAQKLCNAEVIVVDNNSADNSNETVKELFPQITLIENEVNLGFSVANNIGLKAAKGKYVLLLNPDTLIEEDTLKKVVDFMDVTPDCGGVGVKMIDGKGHFLPESKRGLPTPKDAFYKIFGLSKIFPKSKEFNKYHLGYLSENETNEVEVLSGAFMAMRSNMLEKIGMLDETFFMYGEDIDLSYRILKGGYKNYYYPETTIIHYKGESTKKKTANYIKMFYGAMLIFSQKHYSGTNKKLFNLMIRLAIFVRAYLAHGIRFIQKMTIPFIDFAAFYSTFFGIAKYWEGYNKYVPSHYPDSYYYTHLIIYSMVLVLGVFLSGGYDKPVKSKNLIRGIVFFGLVMFAIYGMLPKGLQFSRAILGLGVLLSVAVVFLIRYIYKLLNIFSGQWLSTNQSPLIIIGEKEEIERVLPLLKRDNTERQIVGYLSHKSQKVKGVPYLGKISSLEDAVEIFKVKEVLFCAQNIESTEIISRMNTLKVSDIKFRIAPPSANFIIGSNSKNEPGEWFTYELTFDIKKEKQIRNKRMFDILIALTMPVWFWLALKKDKIKILTSTLPILLGKKTWVSYQSTEYGKGLPTIKKGTLSPWQNKKNISEENKFNSSMYYARHYNFYKDLEVFFGFLK